jgi:hypothetical protein
MPAALRHHRIDDRERGLISYGRAVTRIEPATVAELGRIASLGSLLGLPTASLIRRLTPVAAECGTDLTATISHAFDALSVTTHVAREKARSICGPWLDALAGDQLELELDATSVTARSDEAALPPGSPEHVQALGGELAALGWDGSTWTYVIEQANADAAACEATIARIDRVAEALGITDAQRRIAAELHRSLARSMTSRASLRSRAGQAEPRIGLSWDRVEWRPLQSMLAGFYPSHGAIGQLARIARTCEVDHATVELVLGPTDPPAMRISMRLAGA